MKATDETAMPAPTYPALPAEVFVSLYEYSMANLVLPDDAVRVSLGLDPKEPFLVTLSDAAGRDGIDRFLGILSALHKKRKRKFEEVAPSIRGHTRIYFGRTSAEIYATGSSNTPKKIPGADWYVSSNNSGSQKAEITRNLMNAMGFSWDYAFMVGSLCHSKTPILPYKYQRAYNTLKAELTKMSAITQ